MSQNAPKRPSSFLQEKLTLAKQTAAAITATTTLPLGTVDGDFVVDKFELEDPGGYTSDASNYYDVSLQIKGKAFTAVAATDVCTTAAHNFVTGDAVQVTTTSALPGGLSISTTYYVIVLSSSTYKLATSAVNAAAGTAINITSTGTGTHTISKVLAMYSLVATTGNGDLVPLVFASATLMPNPTGLSGDQLNAVLTKIASGANLSIGAHVVAHVHQL